MTVQFFLQANGIQLHNLLEQAAAMSSAFSPT